MKKLMFAALIALPAMASAHEVWIERDAGGPARIYLGEPEQALPDGGDPEFRHLKAPRLLSAPKAPQVRKAGFIEVAVPAGDVRAWDDDVFTPWTEKDHKEGVIYYARAGRKEATAKLPLEIAPVKSNGNAFRLTQNGKPLAGTEVTVIAPDKSSAKQKTDAAGIVTVATPASGRYLLTAAIKDQGKLSTPKGPVETLHRITTTSFVVS